MRKASGFTLVEVLVALVIMITSMGVLMQLFASGLRQNKKAGHVAHLLVAERAIVHTLERINLGIHGKGAGVAEGLPYQWHVVISEPFIPVYDSDGLSNRKVALFTLMVDIDTGNEKKHHFQYEQLGWKGQ